MPSYMVHVLPPNVPTDIAAVIEPLAVGWHAAKLAGVTGGESVLIVGAGPIGLVTLLSSQAMGAGKTVVVELTTARKRKAAELGADLVLDPDHRRHRRRPRRRVRTGVDIAFDAGGNSKTIELALASVRPEDG